RVARARGRRGEMSRSHRNHARTARSRDRGPRRGRDRRRESPDQACPREAAWARPGSAPPRRPAKLQAAHGGRGIPDDARAAIGKAHVHREPTAARGSRSSAARARARAPLGDGWRAMKAVCWHGPNEVGVETVADPSILNPRDAIVRVTLASICGSDLHAYGGHLPGMERGDILGHEFCGRVVATGARVRNLAPGDRVVVGPVIACGGCFFCARRRWSLCDNSNPNAWLAEQAFGHSPAGSFGSSHLFGGYAGGLAELVRVPFADVGAIPIPDGVSDEQAVLAADVLPAGMMAAEMCDIQPG